MRSTFLALLVLTVSAFPASAQTTSSSTAPQPSRIPGWVFTPGMGVGAGWDDNVLLADPGDAPPDDYLSPVNPSVALDFTGRRTRFSTSYFGSFTFYRSVEELSNHEHNFRAFFDHRITPRVTVFAEETFARAPSTDALRLAGIPFYRVGSRTNTAGGGVEAALSKHTMLRGQYRLRSVGFDFDEVSGRELRGGRAYEGDVSATRALSERLSVGGTFGFTTGTLNQQQPLDVLQGAGIEGDEGFAIYNGGGTVTYRVTPQLRVTGGLGVSRISGTVTQEARIGPTIQLGSAWQGKYMVANLAFQRSFVPAYGFGGTFENEEWIGSVHIPFARSRAYVDSSISWFKNEPLEPTQPDLRWVYLTNNIGYKLTPWLRVEGYYSHSRQNAQRAGSKLSRNQVGFQVITSKPFRLQ